MSIVEPELYYDPYDFDIDTDPYPVWARLREERPLYYNEKYDFYALSRFDDVRRGFLDWHTYSSARGTVLEIIRSGVEIPPGSILFEDPPEHNIYRGLLSRVFTPRRIDALEPQVRRLCQQCLAPLRDVSRFDLVEELGVVVPMRTIGLLLGIPEADQRALREHVDAGLRLETGSMPDDVGRYGTLATSQGELFEEYIAWREQHPSDDVMTELLRAEFEDHTGVRRRLTKTEILTYVGLLNGAGNETTTRLISWAGKVLAEHPDQRAELAEHAELVPGAIEELLRYEAPSPVQARVVQRDVEHHGQQVPAGSVLLFLNGAANRDPRVFEDPDRFDIHRRIDQHLAFGFGIHLCLGAALARLEGRVALQELLRQFPTWEVDWDEAVQARTSTVRGWEKLPIVVR
jgi:cytochrome P450